MATFENNTVTIAGRKLLMQSLVNGVGIEFTHFSIGDGEAPDAPETLTALVHELFPVAVSKTQPSNEEKGVALVRGSFTNDGGKGDFYWRELGLYARTAGSEDEPILFGYTNTGETADYVPNVNIGSKVVIAIMLQIVTGSATVLYVSDPTAAATLQDIEDCKVDIDAKIAEHEADIDAKIAAHQAEIDANLAEQKKAVDDILVDVEAKIDAFTDETIETVSQQVANLQTSIDAAITRLNTAGQGFVDTSGDTMTGNLTMSGGAKVIGNLQGNVTGNVTGNVNGNITGNLSGNVTGNVKGNVTGDVTGDLSGKWQGWQQFSSISELNNATGASLTESSTMLSMGQTMPNKSRLLITPGSAGVVSTTQFPAAYGVLEIIKLSATRIIYTFTAHDGRRWHAAYNGSTWSGWTLSEGSPVGTVEMFAGATAPTGYLLCQGQSLSTTTYSALFAVIGYRYGGSGTSFKLPDCRGLFPRGFDSGRGIDSGRTLGSYQDCAAPNITGSVDPVDGGLDSPTGAFYTVGNNSEHIWASTKSQGGKLCFAASRSSSVYKSGVTEIRPKNIAFNFIIKY